ncbi:MAG: lipopolysaccharide transport system ATP-binding protein [Solirubrobacteraceae bacterium]|jgi:ABC-type polysaccharide/polyol phosphate transport system ATPase subunit|nr:lipopolysaccharide transport system ATP-binding protein [Solirubrobacteraceae bacterium]
MIEAEDVGIHYLFDRQQRTVSPTTARLRRAGGETWALSGVSFAMHRGEGVALLGASGSGKSTLLRTLAGVLEPDVGRLVTHGRVGSLLSVQAGVMALLTGRENTLLLGVLAGMTPRQARAEMAEVKRRSGLGEHYERLVASYSQGMRARLGLAVIERTEPAILLLDEIHEALDHEFRDHIEGYAHELLAAGGVVVATGHDHPMLERLCTRALLLQGGHLLADGPFKQVQHEYLGDRRA